MNFIQDLCRGKKEKDFLCEKFYSCNTLFSSLTDFVHIIPAKLVFLLNFSTRAKSHISIIKMWLQQKSKCNISNLLFFSAILHCNDIFTNSFWFVEICFSFDNSELFHIHATLCQKRIVFRYILVKSRYDMFFGESCKVFYS